MTTIPTPSANRFRFRAWFKGEEPYEEHWQKPCMIQNVQLIYDGYNGGLTGEDDPNHIVGGMGSFGSLLQNDDFVIMQSTGLTDNNEPCAEVFEGDIVSTDGRIIGTQWQDPSLLEDNSNLLVAGLGTADWIATHQEAMARGCKYPKRHAN